MNHGGTGELLTCSTENCRRTAGERQARTAGENCNCLNHGGTGARRTAKSFGNCSILWLRARHSGLLRASGSRSPRREEPRMRSLKTFAVAVALAVAVAVPSVTLRLRGSSRCSSLLQFSFAVLLQFSVLQVSSHRSSAVPPWLMRHSGMGARSGATACRLRDIADGRAALPHRRGQVPTALGDAD